MRTLLPLSEYSRATLATRAQDAAKRAEREYLERARARMDRADAIREHNAKARHHATLANIKAAALKAAA